MSSPVGFLLVGLLFILVTLISSILKKRYLPSTILYLIIGVLLSKAFEFNLLDPITDASSIRLLTEISVSISLFTVGLKLTVPLTWKSWKVPFTLASVSMLLTIFMITLVSHYLLNLPLSPSLLLGAILSPTDPVLASTVQVLNPEDSDQLRFNLTAEGGLNDGTAFPFVMLGLSLIEGKPFESEWPYWIAIDFFWAICGGFFIGHILGKGVGKLVVYFRTHLFQTSSLDDFLAIGLIGVTYGIAVLLHTYGFLAVFGAGLALRRTERKDANVSGPMTRATLNFNEHLDRISELIIVILIGGMISSSYFDWRYLWFALILFFFIRPLSIFIPLPSREHSHKLLLSWFGIRGIGIIYYLTFVIEKGIALDLAKTMTGVTLVVVIASILMHGLSAAPLMLGHSRRNP